MLFSKVRNQSKRSKTGKIITVAAAAIAAMAFVPNANAAVNLHMYGSPQFIEHITVDHSYVATDVIIQGDNGWKPTHCESKGTVDNYGNAVSFEAWTGDDSAELYWSESIPSPTSSTAILPRIIHATYSCDMVKDVVIHPLRWRSFTKTRSGVNTTSRSHSGRCYTVNSGSSLNLDCWGGAYAQGTYRFGLPSDARHIARRIETSQGCCYWLGGSTSKRWVGNTAIVRATGGRQIYVDRVRVTYQHRVRTSVVTQIHTVETGQF